MPVSILSCYVESTSKNDLLVIKELSELSPLSNNDGKDADIIEHNGKYRLLLSKESSKGYFLDPLVPRLLKKLDSPEYIKRILEKYNLQFIFSLLIKDIGADDSVPAPGFGKSFFSFSEVIKPIVEICIDADVKDFSGVNTCKAFYYITSLKQMDFGQINSISGTAPSLFFNKGDIYPGGHKIQDYYCWRADEGLENCAPEKPFNALIDRIKNQEELGQYCKRKRFLSGLDLTYYGIYSRHIEFYS